MRLYITATVVVLGLLSLAGAFTFEKVISHTSSTEFCISCHEMRDNVYEEYKKTSHFNNASGVSPTCSDCHVPKGLFPTLYRKLIAAKDVYHHLLGTIDTPEKFEEHRLSMAKRVWEQMEASDSVECRSCHDFKNMNFEKQRKRAAKQHQNAIRDGDTCIDCHKGIAHKAVHKNLNDETVDENMELELGF